MNNETFFLLTHSLGTRGTLLARRAMECQGYTVPFLTLVLVTPVSLGGMMVSGMRTCRLLKKPCRRRHHARSSSRHG